MVAGKLEGWLLVTRTRSTMSQQTAATSTLRIGPTSSLAGEFSPEAESAASILVKNALLQHFASSAADTDNDNSICIDNKYFTANVELRGIQLDNGHCSTDDILRKEDGLLYAFYDHPTNPESVAPLDALAAVHSAAESTDQAGGLLRLLVAVTIGPVPDRTTKAAEVEYSRRVLWCLDRGFEYVEADCSAEGVTRGHDEREKDGFARIVEAVGGTVWSCAVNKPRGVARPRSRQLDPVASTKEEEEKANPSSISKEQEQELPSRAETSPLPPQQDMDGDEEECGEEGDRFVFDDLEKVMSEAARIRSQARSGDLTDEERRMRASDAAVALMGVLDRMGFDDGSSSNEESSREGDQEGEKVEATTGGVQYR